MQKSKNDFCWEYFCERCIHLKSCQTLKNTCSTFVVNFEHIFHCLLVFLFLTVWEQVNVGWLVMVIRFEINRELKISFKTTLKAVAGRKFLSGYERHDMTATFYVDS